MALDGVICGQTIGKFVRSNVREQIDLHFKNVEQFNESVILDDVFKEKRNV